MQTVQSEQVPLTIRSIVFISLIVCIPALIVALRSEYTGIDTIRYIHILEEPKEILIYRMKTSGELLYWNLCLIFQEYGDVRTFFFLLAFVPLFFCYATFYKVNLIYSPFFSSFIFLLYFYHEFFNATRQMPAVALVFYSYTFILSRKFIPFLICIVIASSFHSTAIAALPLYFLYSRKLMNSWDYFKKMFFIILGFCCFSFIFRYLLSFETFSHYNVYENMMHQVSFGQSLLNFFINYFPMVFILFFFSMSVKFSSEEAKRLFHFLWLVTVCFCLILLFRFVNNWMFRIGFYYQLGEILLMSKICSANNNFQTNKSLMNYSFSFSTICVLLLALLSFVMFNINYFDVSPFINFSLMEFTP